MPNKQSVSGHYGVGRILGSILDALASMGKDTNKLKPEDLSLVDEFHIRGREATVELAERSGLDASMKVLDVGSGLGGSARFLAHEYGCRVSGIDLTQEYVDTARFLSERAGLTDQVTFYQGNACELSFEDKTFDLAWTEHVQMNIKDKRSFYGEIYRVLKPGGEFLFHDVFSRNGQELYFPVPWAGDASISFLWPENRIRETLKGLGFSIEVWEDKSRHSQEWFAKMEKLQKEASIKPLGIHLLMGDSAQIKFQNQVKNLAEGRVRVVQAVAKK